MLYWDKIKQHLNSHGYMSGIDRQSDRVKATGEIFTPTDLVIEILQNMNIDSFAPGKTVLDPACGDGQFLVAAKWLKVYQFNMTEEEANNDIYGVDIMQDNVDLCNKRLGPGAHVICDDTLDPQTNLGKKWFGKPTLESLFV